MGFLKVVANLSKQAIFLFPMLNTWEGAIGFLRKTHVPVPAPVKHIPAPGNESLKIAKLLGWAEADISGKHVTNQYSQYIPHRAVNHWRPFSLALRQVKAGSGCADSFKHSTPTVLQFQGQMCRYRRVYRKCRI